jgi:hypothetical protein
MLRNVAGVPLEPATEDALNAGVSRDHGVCAEAIVHSAITSVSGATATSRVVAGYIPFQAVAKLTLTAERRRFAGRQPLGRSR